MVRRLALFLAALPVGAAARPPSADDFELRPDCQMQLWAAEPDIVDPVGLTFDAAGRAYVLEMRDFPLGMDGKGMPGGTVRLVQDTNRDGRPDKFTLFAEGLRFPTSICAVKDGVVVSAPPEIIFLADRDGDGRAEVRETWFRGFVASLTDSNFNGLRWLMDGRIHGVNGGNGGIVSSPGRPDKFTALAELDFSFDPLTLDFATAYPTGGGFGLIPDDNGRTFVTHNVNHLQMRILPQSVLDEVPGGTALRGTQNISVHGENTRIYAIQEAQTRPNHPEQAGYFSSSGGVGYLNHPGWPAAMAHSLFVCDAASGIVHREILTPDGPVVKCARPPDEQNREFLAGRDPAFRPVGVETGPDGALYVLDMQRDVIEHPDYIPPRMKAKADLRAGSDRGRIWRITPRAGLPLADRLPGSVTAEERVALLASSNQWTRLTAQRLLLEQPSAVAEEALHQLLQKANAGTSPLPLCHALWTLAGLGRLNSIDVRTAAGHPSEEVRRCALQCAAARPQAIDQAARAALSDGYRDPSISVRWEFLLQARGLGLPVGGVTLESAALEVLQRDGANAWMRAAALRALGNAAASAVALVQSRGRAEPDAIHDIARAQRRVGPVSDLLHAAAQISDAAFSSAVSGVLAGSRLNGAPIPISESVADLTRPERMDGLLSLEKAGAVLVREKPARHPVRPGDDIREGWLKDILVRAAADSPARAPWLRVLRHFPFDRVSSVLFSALRADAPPEAQQSALAALRSWQTPEVAQRIVQEWPHLAPGLRPMLAGLMVDRAKFRPFLADALESGVMRAGEISLDLEQRRALLRHSGADIRRKVGKFLTDDEYSNRSAVVDAWLAKLPAAGDPVRGRAAFQKLCFQCHRAGDLGHEVGPDLAAQSHRSVEDLLTHILDPDAAINPNYAAFTATLEDGQTHTGILVSSSGATIVLRQAMGLKVELPRGKVKSLQSTGHSLMPAGMEAAYSPQELRDLIAFIQQR